MCKSSCDMRCVVDKACTVARAIPDPRAQSVANTCDVFRKETSTTEEKLTSLALLAWAFR